MQIGPRGSDAKMPRKKVDNRIRVLIENGVALRQRSMFVIVGDKGRDQVREEGEGQRRLAA